MLGMLQSVRLQLCLLAGICPLVRCQNQDTLIVAVSVSLFVLVVAGVALCVVCIVYRLQGHVHNIRLTAYHRRDRQSNYTMDRANNATTPDHSTRTGILSRTERMRNDLKSGESSVFSIDLEKDGTLDTPGGSRAKKEETKIKVKPRERRKDSKASVSSKTMDGEPPRATAIDSFVL